MKNDNNQEPPARNRKFVAEWALMSMLLFGMALITYGLAVENAENRKHQVEKNVSTPPDETPHHQLQAFHYQNNVPPT